MLLALGASASAFLVERVVVVALCALAGARFFGAGLVAVLASTGVSLLASTLSALGAAFALGFRAGLAVVFLS